MISTHLWKLPFYTLLLNALLIGDLSADIAEDLRINIERNLTAMDENPLDESWYYTITTEQEGEVILSKNNPTLPQLQRVTLVSVNGKPPSAKRIEKFDQERTKQLEDQESQGGAIKYSEMVDIKTLSTVEPATPDNRVAVMSFLPRLRNMEDDRDKFIGLLKLDTESGNIESITIENTEKVSPAFSVSLKTYKTILSFSSQNDTTLIKQLTSVVRGKIGFLKSLDVDVKVTFSDYQKLNTL